MTNREARRAVCSSDVTGKRPADRHLTARARKLPRAGPGGRQTSVRCFSFLAPISRLNPWRRGAPRSCSHLGLAYPPLDPPRVVSPFEGVTSHLMHHTTSLPSLPAWSLHTAGAPYVRTALLRPEDDFLCPGSVFLKRIEFVCLRRTARGASPGRPGAENL